MWPAALEMLQLNVMDRGPLLEGPQHGSYPATELLRHDARPRHPATVDRPPAAFSA